MSRVVRVGAVAYDPKVVTIWEGMREYFAEAGVPTDYVLFSNYEAQVDALFDRVIDVAWNTNVAFVRCEARAPAPCQVLGMRNTDRDFTTRLIAREGSGITGPAELKGKTLALGSADSAQAAIVPLYLLRQAGLEPERDVALLRFDIDVGKHGDTGTSEIEVLRAVEEGRADAGAVGHATWLRLVEEGRVDTARVRSVWTSPPYDHCNFTALPDFDAELARRWSDALLGMRYEDPRWRRLMDLEGLTSWVEGRKEGYRLLQEAMGA
ncbi:MAG TPA: phosphate/phosphite/phosphonate ABC transporter substrate-binding protein [Dehalococcoidia bacterium]|nr:phosphate/phosphite/phosphonate ABC transporter substrate-binding protein [Dehalococcoidia bacterium]